MAPTATGGFVSAQPVEGGPVQLWNLESDAPAGTEADSLVLLGGGIVDRWDEGVGYRLENTATGEIYPYRIPRLPAEFDVIAGGLGRLAFVTFEERLVAFDPATGDSRRRTDERARLARRRGLSASATPDESRVAFTWWDEETRRHGDRRLRSRRPESSS